MRANEVKTTTCYMCACRCGIRVHLENGKLRYIDGNPDHPLYQGVICAKGAERGDYALMPEWRTRPANQYLPRRKTEAPA